MRICVGTFNVRNCVYGFSSGGYVLCRNVTMLLCKGREVFFFYADSLNGDEGCEGHCLDQSKVLLQVVLQTFDLFLVEGGLVVVDGSYLNTKDMRETATTSMSSKLKPLRQKAFLCRMNP